ncbi:dCTP deaminase [Arthrobacter woluwensis]|uniref:dCTP deaminase n=1 Tax=Arthrobacter woluwensis TaxID=156980 RepID=UPI00382737B5
MILTGPAIAQEVAEGAIQIEPFRPGQVNPNSYDLRLAPQLLVYGDRELDVAKENPVQSITIGPEGFVLQPDRIYLGGSVEHVGSDRYVPIVRAKSSIARLGLFVHVTADLIDIGSHGPTTFQLHSVHPLRIYPNMRIAQVTYWVPRGEITLYEGKYRDTRAPMASQAYREFTV